MLKVSCALIINRGKILVAQLGADSAHPFQWEFPGGKIKDNESPESCVKREIKEELEVLVKILTSLESVIYDYGFREVMLIPFVCSIVSGKIALNEHVGISWADLSQLSRFNLAEADRKLIEQERNTQILKKYLGEKMDNTR